MTTGAPFNSVNQAVMEEVKPEADEYVQVVTNDGLPQLLRHKETGAPSDIWPTESFPDLLRRDANFYYSLP